jgi:hypothetical protein
MENRLESGRENAERKREMQQGGSIQRSAFPDFLRTV